MSLSYFYAQCTELRYGEVILKKVINDYFQSYCTFLNGKGECAVYKTRPEACTKYVCIELARHKKRAI